MDAVVSEAELCCAGTCASAYVGVTLLKAGNKRSFNFNREGAAAVAVRGWLRDGTGPMKEGTPVCERTQERMNMSKSRINENMNIKRQGG